MVRSELYLEELICKDAAKIVIDDEFKNDLKNRVIFGENYKDIAKPTKNKNNFRQNKYLKIASGFVICVFVSGTILKAIDIQSENVAVKKEGTSDVTMSIIGQKNLNKPSSEMLALLQPKVAKEDSMINKLISPKPSNNIGTNNLVTNKGTNISENKTNVNPEETDAQINENLVKPGKAASVSIDPKGPIEVPKMDDEKEATTEVLKSYDSRYSFDEKKLVSVKYGGIYVEDIAASKEKKIIAYNDSIYIVNKPNFAPNDGIVYYKAEKVALENGNSGEKNGAIYLYDAGNDKSTKIVDGKNPMISKDGKKIVYEAEGKIYILTLASKDKRFVDNGNYPAWSDNGNLISYVKEQKETQSNDVSSKKIDGNVEKGVSNLWVFNLLTENTYSLTNKETNISNNNIQSWAQAVRSGNVTSNLDIKYSYFESIWCSNNKEIYAIRKNNDAQVYELIKFSLDN